jgi:hypothetical protein
MSFGLSTTKILPNTTQPMKPFQVPYWLHVVAWSLLFLFVVLPAGEAFLSDTFQPMHFLGAGIMFFMVILLSIWEFRKVEEMKTRTVFQVPAIGMLLSYQ